MSSKTKKNGKKPNGKIRTLVSHVPDELFRRIKVASAKADKSTTKWVEEVCRRALAR